MLESSQASLTIGELQERFENFFRSYYTREILRLIRHYPEKKSLEVDFGLLERYDYFLAENLLSHPDESLEAAHKALAAIDLPVVSEVKVKLNVRFYNLPDTARLMISSIRSSEIGRIIVLEGIVRKATDVRPKLILGAFECQRCGHTMYVEQKDEALKEPYLCESCEQKSSYKLIVESSTFIDSQKILIQENLEDLKGGENPKQITVHLEDDLTGKITPGETVEVVGILRTAVRKLGKSSKSKVFEISLDANNSRAVQLEFEDIEITPEDEKEILDFSRREELYDSIQKSIAPHIFGYEEIKEAIMYQLFSAPPIDLPDGGRIRGDSHIILMGEPATGKSELLQYVAKELAPRGIYASGRGTSGAGLTATAVKDEFGDGGWSLEAGALVLADNGVAAVDEFDKMEASDRSAMHEAMEQQSYHYDFEIRLASGQKVKIGEFVDSLINNSRDVIHTKEGAKLFVNDFSIYTSNFGEHFTSPIYSVSRHRAPNHFVKIHYDHGKSVTVTPEHPVFVVRDGQVVTREAKDIEEGDFSPLAVGCCYSGSIELPSIVPERRGIKFPERLDEALGRVLGFLITDGGVEINRGKPSGIMFTNRDRKLVEIFSFDIESLFGIEPYIYERNNGVIYSRVISKDVYMFLKAMGEDTIKTRKEKALPQILFRSNKSVKRELLRAIFEADGHIKKDGTRIGLTMESKKTLEQVQELLMEVGIISYLRDYGNYAKLFITGNDHLLTFFNEVGFISRRKNSRLGAVLKKSSVSRTIKDVLPSSTAQIKNLLEKLRLSQKEVFGHTLTSYTKGGNQFSRKKLRKVVPLLEERIAEIKLLISKIKRAGTFKELRPLREKIKISQHEIADDLGVWHQSVSNWELGRTRGDLTAYRGALLSKAQKMINPVENRITNLKKTLSPEIFPVKVYSKEVVENTNQKWVYDVQIEPTHNFISQGMVLHNSVSIAKAGMLATFRSRCSVLAAANPKYGRFDEYKALSEQVNLPPTILSRFDLIFFVRDDPSQTRDIAKHILDTAATPESMSPQVTPEFLRKYVAYSNQNVFPELDEKARQVIEDFYVEMREMAQEAEDMPIPLTARQLWAIVRLAKARARVRLSGVVTEEDSQVAINLVKSSLRRAGLDMETGQVDIDKIYTGITKSQRDKIKEVLFIIQKLEDKYQTAKKDEIVEEAVNKGIDKSQVRDIIEKLKNQGDIFEPRFEQYKVT